MTTHKFDANHRVPYEGQIVIRIEGGGVAINCLGMPLGAMEPYLAAIGRECFGSTDGVVAVGGALDPPREGAWLILLPPDDTAEDTQA